MTFKHWHVSQLPVEVKGPTLRGRAKRGSLIGLDRIEMAERSGVIENQARDGASERSESSVGEEIGAPGSTWWLNGGRWSERVGAIRSGSEWLVRSDSEWFHDGKGVSWAAF